MFTYKLTLITALSLIFGLISACGQKGALYLPTEPEAKNRATLPQTIIPVKPKPSNNSLP